MQGKQIKQLYDENKAKTLMEKRYRDGLYYDDDDFPEDPDETCLVFSLCCTYCVFMILCRV